MYAILHWTSLCLLWLYVSLYLQTLSGATICAVKLPNSVLVLTWYFHCHKSLVFLHIKPWDDETDMV